MVPSDWLAAGDIGRLTSANVEHQRDINGLYFLAVTRSRRSLQLTTDTKLRDCCYLNDPLREYITSDYAKIELLPRCTFHKNHDEKRFHEEFFESSVTHVPSSNELLELAIDEGGRTGISGIDAIHAACAVVARLQELCSGPVYSLRSKSSPPSVEMPSETMTRCSRSVISTSDASNVPPPKS